MPFITLGAGSNTMKCRPELQGIFLNFGLFSRGIAVADGLVVGLLFFCCFVSYAGLKDEQCLFVTRGRMTRGVDIFKWKGIFFIYVFDGRVWSELSNIFCWACLAEGCKC